MKININIIITFIICCSSCKSQINNNLKKTNPMEKFNIDSFNLKKNNNEFVETKNDTLTRLAEFNDGYFKYTNRIDNPFQDRKVFFKDNQNIKIQATYFYDIPIGIYKIFDKNGNVLEEKNFDIVYNFSTAQLITKMTNEFNVDLLNTKNKGVSLIAEDNKPVYLISLLLGSNPKGDTREVKIDAMNGQLISDEIKKYEE